MGEAGSTGFVAMVSFSRSIKPIQRICQYPMMLKELAGTCEPDSEAAKAVMEAKDIMNVRRSYHCLV